MAAIDRFEPVCAGAIHALQPMACARTGLLLGFEALLRGLDTFGFANAGELFDAAFEAGCLPEVEMRLRRRALASFARHPAFRQVTLFLNLDGRLGGFPDTVQESDLFRELDRLGLRPSSICFELSERFDPQVSPTTSAMMDRYAELGFGFAIDDFGEGVAQMRMLVEHRISLLKLDPFFLRGAGEDSRRHLLLTSIVRMAHGLGIRVVAKGLERPEEYAVCRDIGCDLVQGRLVHAPDTGIEAIPEYFSLPTANALTAELDRSVRDDQLESRLEAIEPVRVDDSLLHLLERFRRNPGASYVPVVDRDGRPLGVVRESMLKGMVYAPFGRELMQNRAVALGVRNYLTRCQVAEASSGLDAILEAFVEAGTEEGVAVTRDGRYCGFVSASSLLRLVHERSLARAQDQNPLTNLPGNRSIVAELQHVLQMTSAGPASIAYFDFDNFKPFNDAFGFAEGDKAILTFARLLQSNLAGTARFVGHIGGDDFVAIFVGLDAAAVEGAVRDLLHRFAQAAAGFYDPVSRQRGWIMAKSRESGMAQTALLRCSAGVILDIRAAGSMAEISRLAAEVKGKAKVADDGFAILVQTDQDAITAVGE